jgi:hypothetical protein
MVLMRTIVTVKNQTIFDIAVQEYGSISAWEEILKLNPGLRNDYSSALEAGVLYYPDEFDFAYPITEGSKIIVDNESPLINSNYLRELNSRTVISFDHID